MYILLNKQYWNMIIDHLSVGYNQDPTNIKNIKEQLYNNLNLHIEKNESDHYLSSELCDLISKVTYCYNSRNNLAGQGQGQGGSNKIRILGRMRKVTPKGRSKLITYKGKQITLTEARKLEKGTIDLIFTSSKDHNFKKIKNLKSS